MTVRMDSRTTTGAFCTAESFLMSVTLASKLGNSTAVIKNGSGGSARLTLEAANHTTITWKSGTPAGIEFTNGVYVEITAAAGDATVSVSYEQPAYG